MSHRQWWLMAIGGVGILAIISLFLRPLIAVDETRYITVAWEMWDRGQFLVPYLNGEFYDHKPPALFWLIHAGESGANPSKVSSSMRTAAKARSRLIARSFASR